MKSILFGHNAKLALAVLAVCGGLFTSCYEKEDVDYTEPTPVLPVYYVAGSITDGTTGQPITNATVTIDGTNAVLTGGSFYHLVDASGVKKVTVSAEGYYNSEKTVFVAPVANGQTFVAIADIALFDASSQVTPPAEDPVTPNLTMEQINEIAEKFTPADVDPENVTVADNGDGTFTVAIKNEIEEETANPTTVTYTYTEGFELTNEPTVETRSVDFKEQFIANVANAISKAHGYKEVTRSAVIDGGGKTILGYTVKSVFNIKEFIFAISGNNYKGTASWCESTKVEPILDAHDIHGNNSNAGGGSGGF